MATVPDLSGNRPRGAPYVDPHYDEDMNSGTVISGSITTVATTATPLPVGQLGNSVTLSAPSANTGIIYVGGPTVSATNGFPLTAGTSTMIEVPDLSLVYYYATVAGDKLNYVGN